MLKYRADLRSLFFMSLSTGTLIYNWSLPEFQWAPFILACLLPMPVYVMTHNHNHVPMWKSPFMNKLQDHWLTLFYGFPTFAWIPTHNQNHHRFNNKAGDDTITYKVTEANNLRSLFSYPLISSSSQMGANYRFIKHQLKNHRAQGIHYLSQLVILIAYLAAALALDWQRALLYIVIPHQIGLNSVLLINYIQHVHADELSEWNHSRNFVGDVTNWIMMNNGYHTVHHENSSRHWSTLKAEHDKVEHLIDSRLKVSMSGYLFKTYILGLFSERFRTTSMRLERIEGEGLAARARQGVHAEADESFALTPAQTQALEALPVL
jgi:fatty acid desaturase